MSDKLYINQSLIKAFFYKGERRDYCPQYVKKQCIDKEVGRETLSMLCGNYFETQCIGSSIGGKKTDDLPRKKITAKQILAGQTIGDKTIDQVRIDQQVMMFNKKKAEYQISIEKDVNTQIGIKKIYSPNDNIIMQGELDIFPASIALPARGLRLCTIDLKLTGKFSDYGEYCWATPANIDPIQGYMYSELTREIDVDFNMQENPDSRLFDVYTPTVQRILKENDPLFFFWIFNYKEDIKNKFIEVDYNLMAKKELYEAIRKTVEEINKNENKGWNDTRPSMNNCSQCAILDCPVRESFKKDVVETKTDFEKI